MEAVDIYIYKSILVYKSSSNLSLRFEKQEGNRECQNNNVEKKSGRKHDERDERILLD